LREKTRLRDCCAGWLRAQSTGELDNPWRGEQRRWRGCQREASDRPVPESQQADGTSAAKDAKVKKETIAGLPATPVDVRGTSAEGSMTEPAVSISERY
jgi:hypothetical protein